MERTAGLLPALRFSKHIDADGRGYTAVSGIVSFPFRVTDVTSGTTTTCVLRYVGLPIRDELALTQSGWQGRGLLFGREFCRFRLVPLGAQAR